MRKYTIFPYLLCACAFFLMPFEGSTQEILDELVIADFNSGMKPNNIGGDFGTWDYDPNDNTQTCEMEFSPLNIHTGENGYCLKLAYDVQSPNPAFNGLWMQLEGKDVTRYNRLSFWVTN